MNFYSQSQPIFGSVIFSLTGILSEVPGLSTNSSLTLQREEPTMNQINNYVQKRNLQALCTLSLVFIKL